MQSVTPECTHSGLGSSAFARRYLRNRVFFLFLRVLRCFSSPGCPPPTYVFSRGMPGLLLAGSPIRRPAGRRVCAPNRGLSQLAASFFACWHQGIHRTPLLTSSYCKSCYHFHNTTKPFRDLLYCLIAWYACLSCVL